MARRGRPSEQSYNAKLVKRANERLRKMELYQFKQKELHDIKFTKLSRTYRDIEKYATEKANGKGKIYREVFNPKSKTTGFRFLGRAEYEQLSQAEKRYFNEMLEQVLNDRSTTKIGVMESYNKAYETFKGSNPQYQNLSFEDYMRTWKTYQDQVAPDKKNHFQYDQLTMIIESGNFNPEFMSNYQFQESKRYNISESSNPFAKMGGKLTYRHRTMADNADKKPRGY